MKFEFPILTSYVSWVQQQGDFAIFLTAMSLGLFIYVYFLLFRSELDGQYIDGGDIFWWGLKFVFFSVLIAGSTVIGFVFLPITVIFFGMMAICHFGALWIIYRTSPLSVLIKYQNVIRNNMTKKE